MYGHTVAAEPRRPLLESCLAIFLVELPRLYFAFSTSVLAVLLRTAGVPVLVCLENLRDMTIFSPSTHFSVIFLTILELISQMTSKLRRVLMYKLFHMFSSL